MQLRPATPYRQTRDYCFDWRSRTYLMGGILNVTPDSSLVRDGGLYDDVNAAIVQARHMRDAVVIILRHWRTSTKPNAVDVSLEEELHRVIPIVKAICRSEALIILLFRLIQQSGCCPTIYRSRSRCN
jgi:dihydropteroate synthase